MFDGCLDGCWIADSGRGHRLEVVSGGGRDGAASLTESGAGWKLEEDRWGSGRGGEVNSWLGCIWSALAVGQVLQLNPGLPRRRLPFLLEGSFDRLGRPLPLVRTVA